MLIQSQTWLASILQLHPFMLEWWPQQMLILSSTDLVCFYKSGSVTVMHACFEVQNGRDDRAVEISGQWQEVGRSDLMLKSAIEHPAWEIRCDKGLGVDGGLKKNTCLLENWYGDKQPVKQILPYLQRTYQQFPAERQLLWEQLWSHRGQNS